MLLMNNFVPSVLMPTRVTYKSGTLIDHIYYNLGNKQNVDTKIICGNFLQDISVHLPNYLIIYNENCNVKKSAVNDKNFLRRK